VSPGAPGVEPARPLYARVLRLRHLKPSSTLCFVFLEGSIALGIVLALAELVDPWGVIVLPLSVAAMVKINDTVAGAVVKSAGKAADPGRRPVVPARRRPPTPPVVGRASVPGGGTVEAGRVYRSDKASWNSPTPQPTDQAALERASRSWSDVGDVADTPAQRARQAATRRYE
jgi:hypothetical protein